MSTLPAWYDRGAAQQGCEAFLGNSDVLLAAYICGSNVEGFSTMLSKSYALTGRLLGGGVRRLRQNLRQLIDMFLPRGIEPSGDGWKLTLRIRMVHAKARKLLHASDGWEHAAWGVPISAAHVSFGAAACSARLLEFASLLGVELDRNDREGIMAVWRYAAHLIGVPDPLLFRSQEEGLRLFQVATACEPPPDLDAIAMANCIVNSVPVAIGISAPKACADLSRYLYRVSR